MRFGALVLSTLFVHAVVLASVPATAFAEDVRSAEAAEGGRRVLVHIDSPQAVNLERRTSRRGGWDVVCSEPCDAAVPADGEFRIVGDGMRSSSVFRLAPQERVVLTVDPSSKGSFALGIVGTSIGGLSLALGFVFVLIGSIGNTISGRDGGLTTTGEVMLVVGGVLTVAGIVGMVSNAHSDVDRSSARPAPAPEAMRALSPEARALPKSATLPIVSLSF